MFCSRCGTENPDTVRYCKNCGNLLFNKYSKELEDQYNLNVCNSIITGICAGFITGVFSAALPSTFSNDPILGQTILFSSLLIIIITLCVSIYTYMKLRKPKKN